MAEIINKEFVLAQKGNEIKLVVAAIGPQVVPKVFPKDEDDQPKTVLTDEETLDVFEAVTREFWRQQVEAHQGEIAAQTAREAVAQQYKTDVFEVAKASEAAEEVVKG